MAGPHWSPLILCPLYCRKQPKDQRSSPINPLTKRELSVHVQKLLFKKYMKNHKIIFFFNKVEEKKITEEELIPLNGLNIYIYIYIGVFTTL